MKKTGKQNIIILSILFLGHLSIAQIGKYNITGNFTMGGSHTYEVQLKNTSGAGTGHDQLEATGNATIAGTLNILLDGYTVNPSDQFEIISYGGTEIGSFSTINWPASMLTWMIDYGVLNPGKVTIYGQSSTLPVEWASFTVEDKAGNHLLKWQIAKDNFAYFIVEHSTTGKSFASLDRLNSQGTSYGLLTYYYTHRTPTEGLNYYRIKQVDFDGKEDYSKIVSIGKESGTSIQFYPNPVAEVLFFSQKVSSVVIYDMKGKEILRSNQVTSLNVSNLQVGTYIINLNNGELKQGMVISK